MPDQDEIFDAALRILLFADRCVTVSISPGGVSIRLPTTRRLAEYLQVPHYYVLPVFAAMERDGLIRRVERVGISTTPEGTTRLLTMTAAAYPGAAEEVLGEGILAELLKRAAVRPDKTVNGEYRHPTPHGKLQSPVSDGEDGTVPD
ncbi:hypothetical protein [Methanoculleus frigidifontis]|uniref:hypothetical protein n=1 Tax=Methanoculleus frigidifontis TaxID=2584085 RepID=UPI0026589E50|nr:hypothetical protein [Methanoculleus sp. FWC-SCC1]